ncbi:MAG: hypothetical protein WC648_04430 [Candidatus Paceibacterota bacterium]|jgi:hypothetical protein
MTALDGERELDGDIDCDFDGDNDDDGETEGDGEVDGDTEKPTDDDSNNIPPPFSCNSLPPSSINKKEFPPVGALGFNEDAILICISRYDETLSHGLGKTSSVR